MDNDNERKIAYSEVINYSIRAMSENAQFSIAIAVGLSGVLTIFVILDSHNGLKSGDELTKKALWTQPVWIQPVAIVLSIAYWALVLFGIQSYLARRLFEGIVGRYRKKMNKERYYDDIRAIAKEKNCQLDGQDHRASNYEKKNRYKGSHTVLVSFLVVSFLLWLFI
jgi:hypothetical protein